MELTKPRQVDLSNSVDTLLELGDEFVEIAKDLSEKFGDIYDLELAKELIEIYEDLGWRVLKIFERF